NLIQLLKTYTHSAQQSLSSSSNILLFKQAIIAAIENYITVNNIVVDGISYSKNTILNNIDVVTLLQGVTYNQNEQVEVNNIVALYYGQSLGSGPIDSSISKPIYNSSSTNSWDVTGFNVANINNTNWQSVNNNIATQLSSMITNLIIINGAYTAKQYVTSYPNELQELISNKVCTEVSTFYEDGLKITPQDLKQFLEVELPNIDDVTETENNNAELNNVNLIYNYPQNSENDAASIIPSGASYYTIKGFLTPQQIQNQAVANYLSSIIPNPIVLPYNNENESIDLGKNATFPFPDGYKNVDFIGKPEYDSSTSAFSAFKSEIINIISNNIKTNNIQINGIVYPKNDILQKIQITLLIKGVTIAQIQSGNVNNMIGIFYGENSNEILTPIYNSAHKNSWDVYSFAPITNDTLNNNMFNWAGDENIVLYLNDKLNGPYNITSIYTAQEYYEACNNMIYGLPYNQEIIDSVNNSIMNEVSNLLPNEVIISGMIITKDEILDNLVPFFNGEEVAGVPTVNNGNELSALYFDFHGIISKSILNLLLQNQNVILIKPK
ncbi:MAG: hypothetical protein IIT78_02315, partial [Mycoplasmataceae bacterium]|nr:hypothetical protein [Mycoplasmataceae bacterium]